jgi:MFS family permease
MGSAKKLPGDTPANDRVDETTPLLGQSIGENGLTKSIGDIALEYSEASSEATHEVDQASVDLDLARVQSISHGGELDAVLPHVQHEEALGSDPRYMHVSAAKFRAIFGAVIFGNTIAFFDSTLMTTTHPVITSYFNSSKSASWLSTAFLLTSTAFQPLLGRISGTFGRKPVYVFSIFVFFVATAWCSVAQSIGSFIAARAVCGVGAGGILALSTILTSDLVRIEYRGIYQSYLNLGYSVGNSSGVIFGGFLCDKLGWRAAFGIQLPLIFIHLLVAFWTTPNSLGMESMGGRKLTPQQLIKRIDFLGSLLLIATVTSLIMGLNLGGNVLSWGHPAVITSLVSFVILAILFIRVELKAKMPVMPISFLWTKPRGNIIFSSFFACVTQQTLLFNTPLFFQAVKLESPTSAGFRMVVSSIGATISSCIAGFVMTWTRRLGPTLWLGSVLLSIGTVTTASLSKEMPDWLAMMCLVPSSLGQGFSYPTITMVLLAVSSRDDQAVATTTLGLWRNLGSVLGVSISSWVLQNSLPIYLEQTITGPNRDEIILLVLESVQSIKKLDSEHRAQGMSSLLLPVA